MMKKQVSFNDLLERFFFYRDYLRPATKRSYRNVIKMIQRRFPDTLVNEIDVDALILWRNEVVGKKINPTTWNNYIRHLKSMYNVAIQYNLLNINSNPFCKLFIREPKPRKKTLTKAQLEKINCILQDETNLPEILKPSWFVLCLINTFRYTGMRCSQLIQLTIQDVNLKERVIHIIPEINKNHTHHVVPISDKLYPHIELLLIKLQERKQPTSAQLFNINLFLDAVNRRKRRRGMLMTSNQITDIFRHLSDLAGFAISPHRFRHTLATQLMRNPENVYIVQKLLNHKDISVTLGYIEHDVEMLRSYVNLL